METKTKFNKVMDVISKCITVLLFVFTACIMIFTIFSVTTIDKNDRNILGYKFYIVQSDSMSASDKNAHLDVHFDAGDIILVKGVDKSTELKAGDIISFISFNKESYGETVTHMIREVKTNSAGKVIGYVTFGTNTDTDDEMPVEPEHILGVYTGKLAGVGKFFAFLKSTPGYIWCILVPFLVLILFNGVDVIRLFRRYKKEQNAIMDAEKAEIAAERQRNEDMLRELMALKEQLEAKNNAASAESGNADNNAGDDTENN